MPIQTINPLNRREHHMARSRRVKSEREITGWSLVASHEPRRLPVMVMLTREAARTMDTDGLAASFKGVRDAVAQWLGVDDADPRVTWEYRQKKAAGFAITIELVCPLDKPLAGV